VRVAEGQSRDIAVMGWQHMHALHREQVAVQQLVKEPSCQALDDLHPRTFLARVITTVTKRIGG